ncbi:nucleosome assembly protein 1,1-like [Rosa sericea]
MTEPRKSKRKWDQFVHVSHKAVQTQMEIDNLGLNMKDTTPAEKEDLRKIHAKIVEQEEIFVKERAKWEAENRCRYNKNEFFINRCRWEAEYKKRHFQSVYEDRRKAVKDVPCFWVTAMYANKIIRKEIAKHDEDALEFLKDIKSCRTDDLKGFQLEFMFDSSNPYFKNEVLTKKYELKDGGECTFLMAVGTEINWYPGKTLTESIEKMTIGSEVVQVAQTCQSFFNFFATKTHRTSLCLDEDADKLKGNIIPLDYAIAVILRDDIIPHAISWFNYDEEAAMDEED